MRFLGLLALLFIGLKLTDHIDWSWWWVLAPIWGPFALALGLFSVVGTLACIESTLRNRKKKQTVHWFTR